MGSFSGTQISWRLLAGIRSWSEPKPKGTTKTTTPKCPLCVFVKRYNQGRWAAHLCALQRGARVTKPSTYIQDFCSLCMTLCPSLCSVPTAALKAAMIDFFFLFYAELGSVIRAPFLTDRSILISKSSACSKGSALWRPARPGRDESDTCWPRRHKAGGRWGAGRELGGWVVRGSSTLCVCVCVRARTRDRSTSKSRTYRRTVRFCWI